MVNGAKKRKEMEMEEFKSTTEEQTRARRRFAASLAMPVKHDLDPAERAALDHLITVANRPTGQGRYVANFLLAWWNAEECGAFDPTDLWGLDIEIANDVCLIFRAIASLAKYPDTLGLEEQFKRLVQRWRPQLIENDEAQD